MVGQSLPAPWCGHCKNLAPEWEKAAQALEGIVNVGAVDMTTDQQAGASYDIRGYPTIKLFGANKNSPVDYNGGRTASAIVQFGLDQAKQVALGRMGGAGGSSSGSQQGSGSGSAGSEAVVTLTSDNFARNVYNSKTVWLVEFYAPWCGHCKVKSPYSETAA
jgi:protein disulfide-isomerase A6